MKKHTQKEYIVIGLGRFGISVAKQLEANGCKVLAIDRDEKKIRQIAEYVTLAMCVDVTNEEALKAVLASIWAKEQGIGLVIAKAYDETQGKILTKIGVDEIVHPEKERGVHLANALAFNNLFDAIELTSEYSIADIDILGSWIGKSLKELNLRKKYGVNVVAIRRGGALVINPDADAPVQKNDIFVLLGLNNTLKRIASM